MACRAVSDRDYRCLDDVGCHPTVGRPSGQQALPPLRRQSPSPPRCSACFSELTVKGCNCLSMTRSGGCGEAPVTKTEMARRWQRRLSDLHHASDRERCMISSASIMGFLVRPGRATGPVELLNLSVFLDEVHKLVVSASDSRSARRLRFPCEPPGGGVRNSRSETSAGGWSLALSVVGGLSSTGGTSPQYW